MQFEGVEIYCTPGVVHILVGWDENGNALKRSMICGCNPQVEYTEERLKRFREVWENNRPKRSSRFKIETVVSNSDPTKRYKLKIYDDGKVECDCKGFQFRRSCKHVEQYKENHV